MKITRNPPNIKQANTEDPKPTMQIPKKLMKSLTDSETVSNPSKTDNPTPSPQINKRQAPFPITGKIKGHACVAATSGQKEAAALVIKETGGRPLL